ncbi:Y-family DNA polymerase [Chitinibacteraceae bacterium HSL-7]
MLWLALDLYRLPLDALGQTDNSTPHVVIERHGSRDVLVTCNDLALKLGLRPGMSHRAALALVNQLTVHPRAREAEAQALRRLGCWGWQFTPHVITLPDALLLEIGGCLDYFGGKTILLDTIRQALSQTAFHAHTAQAPEARAALWLARGRRHGQEDDFAKLPLAVLSLTSPQQQLANQLGLTTVGELAALPRTGLRRRFGEHLALELDEAEGLRPFSAPSFTPPDAFSHRLDFESPIETTALLIRVLENTLPWLEQFLHAHLAHCNTLHLRLQHEDQPDSLYTLRSRRPLMLADDWLQLARERAHRLELPASISALTLTTGALMPLPERSADLFEPQADALPRLLDRLASRLGDQALSQPATCADHRPERAGQHGPASGCVQALRPGWLVHPPRQLDTTADHAPRLAGQQLTVLAGPERIDTGWWDNAAIQRDYYIASSADGCVLWVFHDTQGWWWHGIFA